MALARSSGSSCRLVGFSRDDSLDVRNSFRYAVGQISNSMTKRLVVGEFVHSLNRKGRVLNEDIDDCIDYFMERSLP